MAQKTTNITDWPVMKRKCPTCPFTHNESGRETAPDIADRVRRRCLTEVSQICHHPRIHGEKEDHLCRGARDFQLEFFHRIGFLEAPTDEEWENKQMESAKLGFEHFIWKF